jgi:WD40 repeat protein
LYTGSRDAKLKVWHAPSMELLTSVDAHRSTINSLALLDDLIISASKDKTIKIWDKSVKLIQSIYSVDGGHINSVNKVIAINGMDRFATASDDRSIIIFGQRS